MHLSLGFSSCPNDAFIFDAMVHGKIDTEGIVFDPLIEDVESLNQGALNGHLDITKLSFHAFGYVWDDYVLLNSGSALGRGCGPLVVSKTNQNSRDLDTKQLTVAIPGKYTTANFLFSLVFPEVGDKREILFSEIEDAVLNESVDLGVIIHENRFTFEQRGLVKVLDLGEYWEKETGSPIPLGGIAMKRDKDEAMKLKVDRILKRSVEFAMDNPASSKEYVQELAQEMDERVIEQHIALYVNEYSVDLGEEGRAAVLCLFEKAIELNIFEQSQLELILTTNKS
ncbi:MAG TPA: 1,4-dihydroxy-6-naphthoate synthase [Flavobacteriales bacterium]|nr:1,4-dihydroxy-6-naphthoate synthase [Flavobacteriales bacterium]HIO66822.1 1,4-dihydroxy-6-naphthoate synthase [Flavobacteriales bacterium]